jgi:hypothetical protein
VGKQHRFRPFACEELELRALLTHGGPLNPALIGTLSPNTRAVGPLGRVQAQVNASFDRFSTDYFQAQGAFLSAGSTSGLLPAFKTFTEQRVNLLAQELTRTLARVPGSYTRIANTGQQAQNGSNVVLTGFLNRKINGTGSVGANSLLTTLTSNALLPPAGTAGAGASLYTLAATNAIQTARAASINAVRFMATGAFNNSKH